MSFRLFDRKDQVMIIITCPLRSTPSECNRCQTLHSITLRSDVRRYAIVNLYIDRKAKWPSSVSIATNNLYGRQIRKKLSKRVDEISLNGAQQRFLQLTDALKSLGVLFILTEHP